MKHVNLLSDHSESEPLPKSENLRLRAVAACIHTVNLVYARLIPVSDLVETFVAFSCNNISLCRWRLQHPHFPVTQSNSQRLVSVKQSSHRISCCTNFPDSKTNGSELFLKVHGKYLYLYPVKTLSFSSCRFWTRWAIRLLSSSMSCIKLHHFAWLDFVGSMKTKNIQRFKQKSRIWFPMSLWRLSKPKYIVFISRVQQGSESDRTMYSNGRNG